MDKFLTKFIYDVAAEEPDLDKRTNLKLLKLSPEEWKRVQIFIKLLEVHTCLLLLLLRKWHHFSSWLTVPNKHFHMTVFLLFMQHCLLLRPCFRYGPVQKIIINLLRLKMRSTRHWQKLKNTTKSPQHRNLIHFPWVRTCITCSLHVYANHFSSSQSRYEDVSFCWSLASRPSAKGSWRCRKDRESFILYFHWLLP